MACASLAAVARGVIAGSNHLSFCPSKVKEAMPSILETIAAGIVVSLSLIDKYILPKLDLFSVCKAAPVSPHEEEECMSSSSSAVTADIAHHVHF